MSNSTFKSKYIIDKTHNLIVEYHYGTMVHDDYLNFKKTFFENKDLQLNMFFLIDLGDTKFIYNKKSLIRFANFILKKKHLLKNKIAVIVKSPSLVVVTTLFSTLRIMTNLKMKIFSTEEAAQSWLGLENNVGINLLNQLKNKSV